MRIWLVLLVFPILGFSRERLHFVSGYSLDVDSVRRESDLLLVSMGTGEMQLKAEDIALIESLPGDPKPTIIAPEALDTRALIAREALAHGISEAFVRSVAIVESRLQSSALSPKGAIGVMQLMPETARQLQVDANDLAANIAGGTAYLRELLLKYNGNSGLALAAYNAGPGAVKKYRGVPPFRETQAYILRVLAEYQRQLKNSD